MTVARTRLSVAAAAALATACAGGSTEDVASGPANHVPGRQSSSIVLAGDELVVVDPDVDSVSVLDPLDLQPKARIEVGDQPRQLLLLPSGELVVSLHRGGELVFVDLAARRVTQRVALCGGPFGTALRPDGSIVVGCEYDGRVMAWSSDEIRDLGRVPRVRAVAASGDAVYAASFVGTDARVYRFVDGHAPEAVSPVPRTGAGDDAAAFSATQVSALLPMDDGGLLVAMQLVDNGASDGPAGYGDVIDGAPRVRPVLVRLDASLHVDSVRDYARFDGGDLAFNAPSSLVIGLGGDVLVAHRSSADVAQLDADDGGAVALARVGSGPAGMAVDADSGVIYVDNAFDGSVSRVELDGGAVLTRVRPLPYSVSAAALAGRRTFHDARNVHLTPLGVVACSTCHPEGGDDGLVWHIHAGDVTPRRRRSMHLGVAPVGRAGLHWDGEFADMRSLLSSTIPNLMGGDGLLVDADDVAAYLSELVAPPPARPAIDPDVAARVAAGRAVFEEAGCATCHEGPRFTDERLHAVLSPMSRVAGDTVAAVRTPSLLGVRHRAPYFHDGRSPDLRDLHQRSDATIHRTTALSDEALSALVAYLERL